jgi:hypothetical protein
MGLDEQQIRLENARLREEVSLLFVSILLNYILKN